MEFISPVATQSDQMPPGYERFRIPIAEVAAYQVPGLTVVSQRIMVKDYEFHFHIFDAKQKMQIRPSAGKDIVTIHYMYSGNIDAALRTGRKVALVQGEYNLFELPRHRHYATLLPGKYWCFHLNLGPEIQEILRNDLFMFEFFQESFKQTGGIINLYPCQIEGLETNLLFRILTYQQTGPNAALELKPLLDDLLMTFCDKYSKQLDAYFSRIPVTDEQLANLTAISSYLDRNLSKSHDPGWIARQYQMTKDELEHLYFEIYGRKMSEFYQELRLCNVFSMLLNNTYSLDQIALNMGYSSSEALDELFFKHFGKRMNEVRCYPPREGDTCH